VTHYQLNVRDSIPGMDGDFSLCHHQNWSNHQSTLYLDSYFVTYPNSKVIRNVRSVVFVTTLSQQCSFTA
jgi:hypothetical protein